MTKQCKQCGKNLPVTSFAVADTKRGYRRGVCRDCLRPHLNAYAKASRSRRYHANAGKYRDKLRRKNLERHAKNRAEHYRQNREYEKRHPDRHRAKARVQYALKTGKLTRLPCQVCGVTKTQAHHDDYTRPLDVIWLCRECHAERHRLLARGLIQRHAATETQPVPLATIMRRARQRVRSAVRNGDLVKPFYCSRCGVIPPPARDGRSTLHAHHLNYSDALDVEWLCVRCHNREEGPRKRKSQETAPCPT